MQQDTRVGLLNHTVVVRGYYVRSSLNFDQSGQLTSNSDRGYGPSDARIYVTDVQFDPDRLVISGRHMFSTYDRKLQQFQVALLKESTRIEIALPGDHPLEESLPVLLKQVFLTTGELQQLAACPAEEQARFQDLLAKFSDKAKHKGIQPESKAPDAETFSDVPQMCFPTGERAPLVRRGVKPPKALDTPDPSYTDDARKRRVQGTVILNVIIDKQGRATTFYVDRLLDLGFG